MKRGKLYKGELRVNPFNRNEAYVDIGLDEDVRIQGYHQNRFH